MKMDKVIYLINLFDYYGELLTPKQQAYFKDYYFNNLTLSEIAENENVSRNAIHKQIKDGVNIKKIIKNLDENIKKQIEELL